MATFAHCFVNIGVDLVIIISPIYKVMKLQLFPMRKLGVVLMFALGLVLTAVAILRVVVFFIIAGAVTSPSNLNPSYIGPSLNARSLSSAPIYPLLGPCWFGSFPECSISLVGCHTYKDTHSERTVFSLFHSAERDSQVVKTVSCSVDYGPCLKRN